MPSQAPSISTCVYVFSQPQRSRFFLFYVESGAPSLYGCLWWRKLKNSYTKFLPQTECQFWNFGTTPNSGSISIVGHYTALS